MLDRLNIAGYQLVDTVYERNDTVVCKALRSSDQSPVYLKTSPSADKAETRSRLRREIELARSLPAGLAPYEDLVETTSGPVLVLSDHSTVDLETYFSETRDLRTYLEVFSRVAAGLDAIHESGLVHRDLKPANILIEPAALRPWFIDFGIASILQSRSETALQIGKLEGTLLYMSPEQTGRTNRKVDHRSDLYALGATFYQLLKGEPPYTSRDPLELIHCHLAKEPPPLEKDRNGSFVPAVLQDILRRLMERDPDERYSTAMGLALDLRKCLSLLEGRNQIPPFALGEKDFPRGLMIPQYLYGREKDLEQIREILDGGRASLVLVKGESGSGKSSLIQEIRRNVAERQGMFLPGKFEAHKKDIPYHAILQGISIIVDSLLAEDESSVREWKNYLLERLRGNGAALVQLVPSLEHLIGPQPDLVELAAEEEQVRFRLTLLAFLSAFQEHPLIFVLDDLQWADLASLDLIQDMLQNSENIYILGTYRSNEVNDLHPLKRAIDSYLLNGIELRSIDLQPLGPRDLLRMLLETFRISPASEEANPVKDLAEALFKRSEGNPFVARQYLESLHENGWIQLDREEGKWRFDLARIRMDGLTASSAELMARNLESVAQARDLLQAAACIGSRFSLSMAAGLVEQDVMLTLSQLQEVAKRDFIYPIGEQYKYVDRDSTRKHIEQVYYAFSHDRIYESVLQSIRPSVSEELNLKAARLILNVSNFHEIDEQVGTIVSYYNKGRNLVDSDEEKLTIAKLNLRAGQRERKASAFDEAIVHFGISLDTLFQRREPVPADLRIEIVRNLGEAEYLRGRKIVAQEHFDRVLKDSKSLHDKLKVFEFKIAIMGSGGQFAEAVGLGLQALKKAGIKLKNPRSPESMDLKSLIRQAQKMVPLHRKRRKQKSDPTTLSMARILSQTITPAFLINSNQLPGLLTALMDLSEEKGPFPDTSVALVVLAVMVCQYRDAAEGRKIGEIAQDLVERFNARDVRGRVHYYFLSSVSPWTSDIQNRLPLLQRAADYSLEAGDLPFAALALFDMLGQNLMFGTASLEESESLLARYGPQIHGMGQESLSQMFNLMRQSFHLLKSGSRQRSQIAGDFFDESKVRPQWEDAGTSRSLFYLQLFKNWLGLIYFTDQPAPVRIAGAGAPIAHFDSVFAEYLDCCLSLMQDKKGSADKSAAALLDRLIEYEKQAPTNFGFMRAHLKGELRWKQGDLAGAMDAFDEACALSASSAILGGMIQQRTAAFYLYLRKPRFARIYADRARQIFKQIHSYGQLDQCERMLDEIRLQEVRQAPEDASKSSGGSAMADTAITTTASEAELDLESLMRSSAIVSSEIELDQLIGKLLHTLRESAGAQKAVLLQRSEDTLLVRARQSEMGGIEDRLRPANPEDIPLSIVQFTERNKSPTVLENAAAEGSFQADPYIRNGRIASVLCIPLLLKGEVSSILYLEHPTARGAFPPQRVRLLGLLASQAATSLENARLYEEVRQALEQERKARQSEENINRVIRRFVPDEFLQILGVSDFGRIQLGDNIEKEMTVLFSDIRSFTTLSESMTPEENFRFINSYLSHVGPLVRENGGFIDKYIGDAVMALFEKPDQGVRAARAMMLQLKDYNDGRIKGGYDPIQIGIGLHTGVLRLGIIGEEGRIEGTVIGDSVNLASRLEGLNRQYGTSVIVSETTGEAMSGSTLFQFRKLDRVRVKGKSRPVWIYEMLLDRKIPASWDRAISLYQEGNFAAAHKEFLDLRARLPDDPVTELYTRRLQELKDHPPEVWEGIENLTKK